MNITGGIAAKDFNPRSPRGLRLVLKVPLIMIFRFQSTQPKRAATAGRVRGIVYSGIPIHAAQEGCDLRR